jgi:spore coat polysaccharide biosynthesis protein SpsF (cytidylyltransferase family)
MGGVFAVVQVRMGSSRLPGKIMMEVEGRPLLGHLLDRLSSAQLLDGVVIATSINPENQIIEDYCRERGVPCFRGSEDDVLARISEALSWVGAEIGVEIFGDCPLIDPNIVDELIEIFLNAKGEFDFIGNDLKTTYPPGMEVEVFSVQSLKKSCQLTSDPSIREHGTLFIRQNPQIFKLKNVEARGEFARPEVELEVDTQEDFEVIGKIIKNFSGRSNYSLGDILKFLDQNPEIRDRNKDIPRRWKEFRTEK